jgi:small subunit ribosomal protein S9
MANEPQALSPQGEAPQALSAEREAPQALEPEAPQALSPQDEETEGETPAAPQVEDGGAPEPAAPRRAMPRGYAGEQYNAVGRRKTSVARVILRPGEGRWAVNGRSLEAYFPRAVLQQAAAQPFATTETQGRFDVLVNVNGGGMRGQAEAVRLGVARALLKYDEDLRSRLRADELLTRDPREVERKKPGRPKARKRFQFSKR